MALRSDDKIVIVRTTGGGKQEEFTLDELNTFISTEEDARVTALETAINKAIDGAVVAAVAANQTLTLTGNVTAADTVVIGTTTYTFVNDLTTNTAYMVVKGATASDTLEQPHCSDKQSCWRRCYLRNWHGCSSACYGGGWCWRYNACHGESQGDCIQYDTRPIRLTQDLKSDGATLHQEWH